MSQIADRHADCISQRIDYYLDDAGAVHKGFRVTGQTVFVGFEAGFEPLIVAVRSYLGVRVDADEAVAIAADYLDEIHWSDAPAADCVQFVC